MFSGWQFNFLLKKVILSRVTPFYKAFSYHLHATNSLLWCIRLPLLTMHTYVIFDKYYISLTFSHGLTNG